MPSFVEPATQKRSNIDHRTCVYVNIRGEVGRLGCVIFMVKSEKVNITIAGVALMGGRDFGLG